MISIKRILSLFFILLPMYSYGQVVIKMEKDAGVYKVPCKVNGLKLKFIFDTGASTVSISSTVADMMLENDYLTSSDILGNGYSQIADGKIVDHTRINLKKIEIGGLTLNNIEAVVMHQQSAPLLLGQSAIQKLGKVSISGDQLTIQSYGNENPFLSKPSDYSYDDIARLYKEADNYWESDNYILAAENYDVIYKHGALYLFDIEKYAKCLGNSDVERYDDALNVLLKNENDVIDNGWSIKSTYYYQICRIAYWAKEYNLCIKYAAKCQYVSEFPMKDYELATYWMAQSYEKLGNSYKSRSTFNSFISSYLSFMEISATDCWDKEYSDSILADQYYGIALSYDTYGEGKKYYIISAAWGNKDAIEACKEFDWSYTTKPYDYVY